MKTVIASLIMMTLFFVSQTSAQNKVLKINFSKEENQWMMYPPNTVFNLVDENLNTVFSNNNEKGIFEIKEKYRLEIFPKYKSDADVYILEKGSIEIIERDSFTSKNKEKAFAKKEHYTTIIAATKTITDSKIKKGRKNLVLNFTNGITFKYTDGKIEATLNDKDIYVEGKYVLYCKLGVAKISFNPKNGETWWVFDADKN